MVKAILAAIGPILLAGCATIPSAPKAPDVITYATEPCFGRCPVYRLTVSSDGVAVFEGKANTLVTGRRTFVVKEEEYQAFKAMLEPHRPVGERIIRPGSEECRNAATDHPGVDIRWATEDRSDHLSAYYGCDMDLNRDMYEALMRAPYELPMTIYIGQY
ncbi:DUF6438 domain-containing protein [Sphingomicrobium lutaoense]|uniref:DUF6438 domain-containing protein n=1 Tax=Sphingomicrobium lutaoense TaxID=515949 RepID=A0A839YYB8_9SPHN|nr:DUF6438 domain-containing protein [Sphingomicrobium lutaoense]MBB3764006.1 hypothetical protein [Sphingomicrobium lutaoense]